MYFLKHRKALFLGNVFLLASVLGLKAQQTKVESDSLLSQSSIAQWTSDNGLASNNITSAIRDHDGFVWITSYNGIMRFDGIQADMYDETKIPSFTNGAIYTVEEQMPGVLWFTSQNNGVLRFRNGQFDNIDPEGKILPKSVRCLRFDKDSTVWVGTNNSGLYKIQGKIISKVDLPELHKATIIEMSIDANHVLWIAAGGKGLFSYDGKKLESIQGLSSTIVNSVYIAPDNSILIGTLAGLDIYKSGKITHHSKLKNFTVNKVICDRYNRVWVGTEFGLGRFILGNEENFSFIGENDGFPLSRINSLYFDDENSLWLSTGRDGLVQLRETTIVNISKQQGLANSKSNIVYEGSGNNFYIGSDGGGLDLYKNGKITPIKLQTPLFEAGIRDIYQDDNDNLWLASYRGLLKKSKTDEQLYDLKDGLTAIDIRRILPAEHGDLWLASRSGGLMKFSSGKVITKYNKENGLNSSYILALEKDKEGNLYLGTHSGGMAIITKDGQVKKFSLTSSDEGILIFNIHIDEQGKIWVVSGVGLFHFDGKAFKKIILAKSLKGEVFFDWIEDHLGNVWITSSVGVLKITKSEIERHLRGEVPEVNFKLIDSRDGMKNKECTAATHALFSSDRRIWVPTINGVSLLYPEKLLESKILPPVYITSFSVDDQKIESGSSMIIKPGRIRYNFTYTAPSFIKPKKIQFKYKLENVDAAWINAGTERQVTYTNLAPGNYTFKVIACNSDGYWNENGATLTFTVQPFYYQTWWFYAIVIGSFAFGTMMFVRWKTKEEKMKSVRLEHEVQKRTRQLKQKSEALEDQNREKTAMINIVAHDLKAPLNKIKGLMSLLKMTTEFSVEQQEYVDYIDQSISQGNQLIRDLLDVHSFDHDESKLELGEINLVSLLNEWLRGAEAQLQHKHQRLLSQIEVDENVSIFTDHHMLIRILDNLLTNASKFSHKGKEIYFRVWQMDDKINFSIRDQGPGISDADKKKLFGRFQKLSARPTAGESSSGLGLSIIKVLVAKLGGSITVHSNPGDGAEFIFILPVGSGVSQSVSTTDLVN